MDIRHVAITSREADVLTELLRDGAANKVICSRLYLSEDTVKSHMKSLLKKTGTHDRTALVVAVMRGHVIPVRAVLHRNGTELQAYPVAA